MKIYFMSSPRSKKVLNTGIEAIFSAIKDLGHTNVTDFIHAVDVDKFYLSDIQAFYKQTIHDLKLADICVFEASEPSLATGHLISTALEFEKPVIVLYVDGKLPFFLTGVHDDKIQVLEYTPATVKDTLKEAIQFAQDSADTRFNFFISPKIGTYLDWVSKKKRVPRAVYLRRLIEDDMKKTKEYEE